MEISNRKLFSRGIAALGLAVAFSSTAETVAAETACVEGAATASPTQCQGLSQSEQTARTQKLMAQDEKLAQARSLHQQQKYQEAADLYDAVINDLIAMDQEADAEVVKSRLAAFQSESSKLRREWAENVLQRARLAFADGRYADAAAIAADVQVIDESSEADAAKLIEACRRRQRAAEQENASSMKTADPEFSARQAEIDRLMNEARVFMGKQRYDEARNRLEQVFVLDPYNANAIEQMAQLYRLYYNAGDQRRDADVSGLIAYAGWQWAEPVFVGAPTTDLPVSTERKTDNDSIYAKMERIIFPSINFEDADIMAVIRFLNNRSKTFDPDKEGVNISTGISAAMVEQLPKVTMEFARIPMSEVLRYICQDTGMKYRVEGNGIFIGPEVDEMQTQRFQVRSHLIAGITGTEDLGSEDTEMGGMGMGGMGMGMGGMGGMGGGAAGGRGAAAEDPANAGIGGGRGGMGGGMGGGDAGVDPSFLEAGTQIKSQKVTEGMLKRYFSDRGVEFKNGSSITYNKRAGKLTVRNTIENLRRLDELIRQLDAIETPLVMIEIKCIEISEEDMQELGFDWQLGLLNSDMDNTGKIINGAQNGWVFGQGAARQSNIRSGVTGVTNTSVISNLDIFPALFGSQHPFGSDLPFNLTVTINALSRHTRSESLSAPKVLTINGSEASVDMFKTYYFPEDWEEMEEDDDNGVTGPKPTFGDSTKIGISFKATPRVNPDNYTINLKLSPKVTGYVGKDSYSVTVTGVRREIQSETVGGVVQNKWVDVETTQVYDVWMPIITTREMDVNVNVYDGEMLVLGGMVDNRVDTRTDKWPILGDLPYIGRFFQSQSENMVRKNMLMFVTTRLVNNDGVPIRRNQTNGAPDFNR